MKSRRARIAIAILRYGVCAAALVFLFYAVPWHDHVRLDDAEKTRVRLVEQRGDEFIILRNGQRDVIPAEAVHWVDIKGRIVPDIEPGLPTVVKDVDVTKALYALLLFMPVPLLAAIRLVWMLKVQEVALSFWNAIKLTFAGNFFNFALPGTTGGDLVKAWYITRFTHKKTEAVTTIFLDRVVGLSSLVILAGAMMMLTRDRAQFAQIAAGVGLILAALAVGVVVVFSSRIRRALGLRKLIERLPFSEHLHRIGDATLAMRRRKVLVILSLLITFVLQSSVIVSAAVLAWALGMQGSLAYFFVYVAIGFLISAIPIAPPQGIGVMEGFYVWSFTQGDVNTASQAVALAVGVRLIQLAWSLPGVLVPLFGLHLPRRDELAALEAEFEEAGAPPHDAATSGDLPATTSGQ